MSKDEPNKIDHRAVDALYEEGRYWHVNTGDEKIHAKRMPGKYRRLKWIASATWLLYLAGPYLRWQGQQAVLFDIAERKFYIFSLTLLPQDIWMLAMVLLFFAMLLAAVTSLAGRVYCGYFCFQTVWTDIFVWIEERLEGPPQKRIRFDNARWDFHKIRIKLLKYFIWLLIGLLTGITFTLWFADAYGLWWDYLHFKAPPLAYLVVLVFCAFTLLFAGRMREQVCFWLCPYARIQGVMVDSSTVLPTYDFNRGEPRGKLKRNQTNTQQGDCIDCKLCVAVCPTGIDIRHGQQEGCITCALCLDACDSVMRKINRPTGLIAYQSLDQVVGKKSQRWYKRPRFIIYSLILMGALSAIGYGIGHLGDLELKVLHERQPLFVVLSSGAIQNKYELKILNKTDQRLIVNVSIKQDGLTLVKDRDPYSVPAGEVSAVTVYVRMQVAGLQRLKSQGGRTPVQFEISNTQNPAMKAGYTSMFFGPK